MEGATMGSAEVPPFFLCPISLQIMEDPVTLSTGVTYDRRSIELWLSSYGHKTCPVTNQPLPDRSLTPNTTLLNLIHSWKTATSSSSSSSASTSTNTHDGIDLDDLRSISAELRSPNLQAKTLEAIAKLVQSNEGYKDCMEEHGITKLVAAVACRSRSPAEGPWLTSPSSALVDEATSLFYLLRPSQPLLKGLAELDNKELVSALSATVQKGSHRARVHAALLLDAALRAADDWVRAHSPAGVIDAAVEILKDQNSERSTTMAALSVLMQVAAANGRNRVMAVEAGAVAVLVELLAEEAGGDRRRCEAMLAVMAALCGCAEGRAALSGHPVGIAAVAGKVLQASRVATERALKALQAMCRWGGRRVAEELMEVGAVGRLLMVVQVEPPGKAREMAKEIIGMHLTRWSKSPCFPKLISTPLDRA